MKESQIFKVVIEGEKDVQKLVNWAIELSTTTAFSCDKNAQQIFAKKLRTAEAEGCPNVCWVIPLWEIERMTRDHNMWDKLDDRERYEFFGRIISDVFTR